MYGSVGRTTLPCVSKNAPGGVASRSTHDPTARVCCRPTHPQIPYRGRVTRPAGNRTQEEQLVEGKLALKDIALR